MATKFAQTSSHALVPAVEAKHWFARPAGLARAAVTKALNNLTGPREAKLEAMCPIDRYAEARAIATEELSPAMYVAFERWLEAGHRFVSYDEWPSYDDAVGDRLCGVNSEAMRQLSRVPAVTATDLELKAYLAVVEISDGVVLTPLDENFEHDGCNVDYLAAGMIRDLEARSRLVRALTGKPSGPATPTSAAWSAALREYLAAEDAMNAYYDEVYAPTQTEGAEYQAIEDAWNASVNKRCDALEDLLMTAAPSMQAVRTKLDFYNNREVHGFSAAPDILCTIEADVVRLTAESRRQPQGDDAGLVSAFAGLRAEMLAYHNRADDSNEDDDDASDRRVDEMEGVLIASQAKTVEGIVGKLRLAFQHKSTERWSDHCMMNPMVPAFVDGIRSADVYDQLFWSSIEDLARIGGVSLAEQGA